MHLPIPPWTLRSFRDADLDSLVRYADNARVSARVLEKSGFTLEGTLRQSVSKRGRILDEKVYSILRNEVA